MSTRLLYSGIHKNVGFIVQHCGGYDREYDITKTAEELNVNRDSLKFIFNESSKINRLKYLEMLKQGISMTEVFKHMDIDNIRKSETISTLPMLSMYSLLLSNYTSREFERITRWTRTR